MGKLFEYLEKKFRLKVVSFFQKVIKEVRYTYDKAGVPASLTIPTVIFRFFPENRYAMLQKNDIFC